MYYMSLVVYKYLDTNVCILIISEYEYTMFCHGKRSNEVQLKQYTDIVFQN